METPSLIARERRNDNGIYSVLINHCGRDLGATIYSYMPGFTDHLIEVRSSHCRFKSQGRHPTIARIEGRIIRNSNGGGAVAVSQCVAELIVAASSAKLFDE